MRKCISRSVIKGHLTLIVAALVAAYATPTQAADRYWACGSNAWNTNCWASTFAGAASGPPPLTNDNAWLIQNDAVNRVVSYINTQSPDTLLGNVVVNATGSGSMTLEQGRDAMRTQYLYVGTSGTGTYVQTGGTASASEKISLGYDATGNGLYNLQGGSLTSGNEYIGDNGRGRFVQTGGTHSIGGQMQIGFGSGSAGTFELSGGTVTSAATVLGRQGSGTFEQSNGVHTVGTLNLAVESGSLSDYRLFGGTLNVGNITAGAGSSIVEILGGTLKLTGSLFSVNSLLLDHNNGATFSLQSGQTLATRNVTFVGYNQYGSISNAGGTHTAVELWIRGNGASVYALSGAGQLTVDGTLNIAGAGGEFRQTGGTATIGTLFLGTFGSSTTNATQLVTLAGGSLTTGRLWNGQGTGTVNIDGGTLKVLDAAFDVDVFQVGAAAASNGSFELGAGQSMTSASTVIGKVGIGKYFQTSGNHQATVLMLGEQAGSNGYYNLYGNGSLRSTTQTLGQAGAAIFDQVGGTNSVSDTLRLGVLPGSVGSYLLADGTLTTGRLTLGVDGFASFEHGAGAVLVNDRLEISTGLGLAPGGAGGTFYMGRQGNQGTLDTAYTVVGAGHVGFFYQDAGRHTATVAIWLGEATQGDGLYVLGGGSVITPTLVIGKLGQGKFTAANASVTLGDSLIVGEGEGSIGRLELWNGSVLTAPLEVIGLHGAGAVQQYDGVNTTTTLRIAADKSPGIYSMAGGTFTADDAYVGAGNTGGTFAQSAGVARFTNSLVLGNEAGATGDYILNGSGTVLSKDTTVGVGGTGRYTQRGGTHTVSNALALGFSATGMGSYSLEGNGVLDSPFTLIGVAGSGSFTQIAGTHRSTQLTLGFSAGGMGEYLLRGGTLNTQSVMVGGYGNGSFVQTGGTHTTATLTLANEASGIGSYVLSGGVLNVGQLQRGAGNGSFTWTAGTLQLTASDLEVDDGTFFGRNFALAAGMTFIAANQHVAANGSVLQTGGSNTALQDLRIDGRYTLAGGTLYAQGALDNSGQFTLAGGSMEGAGVLTNNNLLSGWGRIAGSGGFINQASLVQSGGHLTLANSGGSLNLGNWDLAAGWQLRLDEAHFDNAGALNLNGSSIVGVGQLNNVVGGIITGRGTISTSFANVGGTVLLESGNLRIQQNFHNDGAIVLGGPTASLTGGALQNYGIVQGRGNIGNEVSNFGTVEALGGSLVISGRVTNEVGGLLRVSEGGKLLITTANGGNAGTVSLIGGTLDTGAQSLTSTGSIAGHGLLATGTLFNGGKVTLAGGNSTVNGPVTNDVAGRIEVAHSSAVFTGPVENYGVFKTTNATVTFAGGYLEGGLYLSDPSDNQFSTLTVAAGGALQGGVGDRFLVSGNFINLSLQALLWNTEAAQLVLNGRTTQQVLLAGADLGADAAAWQHNYAWGSLSLASGSSVSFLDGNATPGAALYVGSFELAGGLAQLAQVISPFNIYYDPAAPANAYLSGRDYGLAGGGHLVAAVPVPEPDTAVLWLAGLAVMGWRARSWPARQRYS